MARLHHWSFEQNTTDISMELSQTNGVVVIQNTVARIAGGWAQEVVTLVSGTSQRATGRFVNTAASGPYYCRGYIRVDTLPSASNTIMRLEGALVAVRVTLDAAGTLTLIDEDGTIGTSSQVLSLGQWYRIELELDATGAGATDIVGLYVDGAQAVRSTTRDVANTVHSLSTGGNMNSEAQTQGHWYWDDCAANDNTGTVDNSFPGPGYILHMLPASEGDADVGVTRGGADSGTNYGQVAEQTPNDLTDYVDLTTTTSVIWVGLAASPASIPSGSVIKFVAVGARVTAAGAGTTNFIPSIKSQSSGVEVDGTNVSIATVTFGKQDDTAGLRQYKLYQYTDPQGSGAWTKALLDSIQIAAKTTDGSPALRVSTLWASVEFTPPPVDSDYLIYQVRQGWRR